VSSIPNKELVQIAKRVAWFDEPEAILENPLLFLAQVMTHGTLADVVFAKKAFGLKMFREALEVAPPGVFDERSWAYWNLVCGRRPAPPLPQRSYK